MTIVTFIVHIFESGRYVRTVEKLLSQKGAHRFANTFNARQADVMVNLDPRGTARRPQRAVVEALEIPVSPPEFVPATDPLGPGVRPTRRLPAVS